MAEDTYTAFMQLLKEDTRYRMEAYQFVREALSYGQRFQQQDEELDDDLDDELAEAFGEVEDLELSAYDDDDDDEDDLDDEELEDDEDDLEDEEELLDDPDLWEEAEESERHLTGQVLCQAIREYALQQYGLLAKTVLNSWGIYTTGDFGEIVYNLIGIGMMRKSKSDRREDFDDQYDFEDAFVKNFEFELSEEPGQA